MASRPTVLDGLLGPATIRKDGVDFPQRSIVELDGSGASVADDPVTKVTKLTISGGSPAGDGSEVQYRGAGGEFAAIPGVTGSDEGLSIGSSGLRTSDNTAVKYDEATSSLYVGGAGPGVDPHLRTVVKAANAVGIDAPVLESETLAATRFVVGNDCVVAAKLLRFTTPDDTPTSVVVFNVSDDILSATGEFLRVDLVIAARGASLGSGGSHSIRALFTKTGGSLTRVDGGTDPLPYGGGTFEAECVASTGAGPQIKLTVTGDFMGTTVWFVEARAQAIGSS